MNRFLTDTQSKMLGWMFIFISLFSLSVLMMDIWSYYRTPAPAEDLAISATRRAFYVGLLAHSTHTTCVLRQVPMPELTGAVQERIFTARYRISPQMTCEELLAIEHGE
jgi:hypothetical protein